MIGPVKPREFKDQAYGLLARAGRALANGHRLELLDLVEQTERSVDELASMAGMSVANTSQHLQVLRRAGLVTARRSGTHAYYRLGSPAAASLWRGLRAFGEAELPELERIIDQYLTDRSQLDAIDARELRSRLERDEVVLIDVRPRVEYEAGHIPGSRSIPIDDLHDYIDGLPASIEIIAYCRGRYCVYSDDAVRTLREHGFAARRFEGNVGDWNAGIGTEGRWID
ncbi:MAG: metalloregulator ArsR/SmtB family transcription factor [Acidobacteria bacterium]|nr:metalloregulator ArsR/SmtB family transcription factor [Acidobacteriota bacterium]